MNTTDSIPTRFIETAVENRVTSESLFRRLPWKPHAALLERGLFGWSVIFMALTLIKEDGTGKADANAYADVADGDAYHAGHLYATAWTAATADQKAVALVMATRLIDAEYQFNGTRTTAARLCNGRVRCVPIRTRPCADLGAAADSV